MTRGEECRFTDPICGTAFPPGMSPFVYCAVSGIGYVGFVRIFVSTVRLIVDGARRWHTETPLRKLAIPDVRQQSFDTKSRAFGCGTLRRETATTRLGETGGARSAG